MGGVTFGYSMVPTGIVEFSLSVANSADCEKTGHKDGGEIPPTVAPFSCRGLERKPNERQGSLVWVLRG